MVYELINQPRFTAVYVDDTLLIDPVIQGNPNIYNFNPFTTDINMVRGQESNFIPWTPIITPQVHLSVTET